MGSKVQIQASSLPMELPSHESLSQLALNDPQAYETLRSKLIESFIASAPPRIRPRLSGIQFRVDNIRRMSRSALGATLKIYNLMWESFHCLNHGWQDVIHMKRERFDVTCSSMSKDYVSHGSARIIEFRPRPRSDLDVRADHSRP